MAKRIYLGDGNVARKVRKAYIGVGNVVRKVKKGYIGVGGVARAFWTGGELAYYGTATSLSAGHSGQGRTTVGEQYALFCGGRNASQAYVTTVNAYNSSLVRSVPTALSEAREYIGNTHIGNYGLFIGGRIASTQGAVATTAVDIYNTSLTRTVTSLGTTRYQAKAARVGNYAIIPGGPTRSSNTSTTYTAIVDVFDANLTRTNASALSTATAPNVVTAGNYAVCSTGEVYNTSLTKSTVAQVGTSAGVTTSIGNYGLFIIGGATTTVAYNSNLVRSTVTGLSVVRDSFDVTTIEEYALVAGGRISSSVDSAVVDVYNADLVRSTTTNLSVARRDLAAASVGNYALITGGWMYVNSATFYTTVDVYTVN